MKRHIFLVLLIISIAFSVFGQGPIVTVHLPDLGSWAGCTYQEVHAALVDPDGIDTLSIIFEFDGTLISYPDPTLQFIDDTLLIYTPPTPLAHDVIYDFSIVAVSDNFGNPLAAPVDSWFHTDFDDPYFYPESRWPPPDTVLTTTYFDVSIMVTDQTSGIVPVGLCLCLESAYHSCPTSRSSGFCWNPGTPAIYYTDSTFYVDHSVLNFATEDSVKICLRMAVDRVQEDPLYCGPNWIDTTDPNLCWEFLVDKAPPRVILDYPNIGDTIACDTLVFHLEDMSGIDTAYTRMNISWAGNYNCGTSPYLRSDGTYFYFSGSGTPDYNEGYLRIIIDRVRDLLGNDSSSGTYWNFFVDKTPPYVSSMSPPGGSAILDASPTFTAGVADARTRVEPTSIVVSIDGAEYDFSHPATSWDGSRITFDCGTAGLSYTNGDIVEFCIAEVCDIVRVDRCGPNCIDDPICYEYYIDLGGPTAEYVYPTDDGYTACPYQVIKWWLFDGAGVNTSTIQVSIDGVLYSYPDHLTFESDTLIFTPTLPFAHGDMIDCILISAEDIFGNALEPVDPGIFYIDLLPPDFADLLPPPDEFLPSTVLNLISHITDADAGVDETTAIVTIRSFDASYPIGFSWDGSDELTYTIDLSTTGLVLSDSETLLVCLEIGDDIPIEYCGPNLNDTCTTIITDLGAPVVEYLSPGDSVITACNDGELRFFFDDQNGVDPSSIELSVNGSVYGISSPRMSMSGDTLIFVPSPGFAHGSSVEIYFIDYADTLGNHVIPGSTDHWWLFIDTENPIMLSHYPTAWDTLADPTPQIRISFEDIPSGLLPDSFEITINGATYDNSSSAMYFVGNQMFFSTDSTGTIYDSDDTIEVCITRTADAMAEIYCGPNMGDPGYCFSFLLNLTGPSAELISPSDGSISSCPFQQIRVLLHDPDGVIEDSTIVRINGITYPIGSWTMHGDTLVFVHLTPLMDGDSVEVTLGQAYDGLGNGTFGIDLGSFVIDVMPPVFVSMAPPPSTYLSDASPIVAMNFTDNISGVDPSSLVISINGISYTYSEPAFSFAAPEYSIDFDALGISAVDGDTIEICIDEIGDLALYCGSNTDDPDTCWEYYADFSAPDFALIFPDSAVLTACESQELAIRVIDNFDILEDSLRIRVDEIEYNLASVEMNLVGDSLHYTPSSPYAHGDTVEFMLRNLWDNAGNEASSFPTWFFALDLLAPIVTDVTFSPAADTTPSVVIVLEDEPAGIDESSIEINFNGTVLTTASSGVSFDVLTGTLTVDPDIVFTDESLTVCISVDDNVSLLHCGPNILTDTCFIHTLDVNGPIAELISPFDGAYSACADLGISISLYDDFSIAPLTINLTVDGIDYDIADIELSYIGDSVLVFIPSIPFPDGPIDVHLWGVEDNNGNPGEELTFTYTVDTDPPEISSISPSAGSDIPTIGSIFTIGLDDLYSGVDPASILISIGSDDLTIGDACVSWDGAVLTLDPGVCGIGFEDGEVVDICFSAGDSPDYCDPNSMDSCWSVFVNDGGPTSELIAPEVSVISACDIIDIMYQLTDPNGIDPASIRLEYNGTVYSVSDPEMYLSASSRLIFTTPVLVDGDTCRFRLLAADDIYGSELATVEPEYWFIVDISPPVITHIYPPPRSFFTTPDTPIEIGIFDSISGVDPASISFTLASSMYTYPFAGTDITFEDDTLSFTLAGCAFEPADGESTRVCIREVYDMPDVCDPNGLLEDICFKYFFDYSGPNASMYSPVDSTITTCYEIPLSFYLMDAVGVDTSTILVMIDGIVYDITSPNLEYTYPTLHFSPDTAWAEGGYISIVILAASDLAGNDLVDAPREFAFGIDTTAPDVEILYPPDGSLIATSTPEIRVRVSDNFAGIFLPSLHIKINDVRLVPGDAGVTFEDSLLIVDTDEAGLMLESGEVTVCVDSIYDWSVDITGACERNISGIECFTFTIESAGPYANMITPANGSYSSCTDGQIELLFRDSNGIDWAYLLLEVNDTLHYDYYSAAIEGVTDSTILISAPGLSHDGDTVTILLNRIADTLGVETVRETPWYYITDTQPPLAYLIAPLDSMVTDGTGDILFSIEDLGAGVFDSSIVFYTSNGDSLSLGEFYYSHDSVLIDISDLAFADGDTIRYCLEASDLAGYCGHNDMVPYCHTLYIDMTPPNAVFIDPFDGAYVSCPMQEISMYINDLWGLDTSSIRIDINGSEYSYGDSELAFDDSLLVYEPSTSWTSGDIIHVEILSAADAIGNAITEIVSTDFIIDLDPPVLIDFEPTSATISADTRLPIRVQLADSISGIDFDTIELLVNGEIHTVGTGGIYIDGDFVNFNPESLGIYYSDFDTVYWCIQASDLANDYCDANIMTEYCDSFIINSSGPRASIITPTDGSIISCEAGDYEIVLSLDDPDGIVGDSIRLFVNDSLISLDDIDYSADTLRYIPFEDFASGSVIDCRLQYAIDSLGNPLSMPLFWSFTIDRDPPYIYESSPSDGSSLPYVPDEYYMVVVDDISNVNDTTVEISIDGATYSIGSGLYFRGDTFIVALDSIRTMLSDTVEFCLEYAEDIVDLCDANISERDCIRFTVPEAAFSARFIRPPCDEVISCVGDEQEVRLLISSIGELELSEITLATATDTFTLSSSEIELRGDTLVYSPSVSWVNGDTISISLLTASDIHGHELSEPVNCEFYIDLQAPTVSSIRPIESSFISSVNPLIELRIFDNYDLDLSHLLFYSDSLSTSWTDGFMSFEDSVLSIDLASAGMTLPAGTTITVCIDSVMDYPALCEPNDTFFCYDFFIDNVPPMSSIEFPFDGAVLSCSDSGFYGLIYDDFSGLVEDSVIAMVNSIEYRLVDSELEFEASDSSLTYSPSLPHSSGEIISVEIFNVFDIAGNTAPILEIEYVIDLDPPIVTEFYPSYDAIVADGTPVAWFILLDSIAGLDSSSVVVALNGVEYGIDTSEAFFISGDTVFFDAAIGGFVYETDDTVEYCILYAQDNPDFCEPNILDSMICTRFSINADGPIGDILKPSEGDYISCSGDSQYISFIISDPDGIEWDSLHIICNDEDYYSSSPEIEIGDTCYFRPDPLWADGESVDFTIETAFDTDGYAMDISPVLSFIIDIAPPELISVTPLPYTAISDTLPEICMNIREIGSGLDLGALRITVNDSRDIDTTSSALHYADSVLCFYADSFGVLHDSARVCLTAIDMPDLCDANLLDTCFTIYIGEIGPLAERILPVPGEYISCPNGIVSVFFEDEDGLIYDSLGFIINEDTLLWADRPDSMWLNGDTLSWISPTPIAMGETLWVQPIGRDNLYNRLRNDLMIPIITDTLPGYLNSSIPSYGETILDWIYDLEIELIDELASVNDTLVSIEIITSFFDTVVTSDDDAFSVDRGYCEFDHLLFNGGIDEWYAGADSELLFYHEFDSVSVVVNHCDMAKYCGPNCASDTFGFLIADDDTIRPEISIEDAAIRVIAGEEIEVQVIARDASGINPDSVYLHFDDDGEIEVDSETILMMQIGISDTFSVIIGPFDVIGDTVIIAASCCDMDFDFENDLDILCNQSDTFKYEILNNLPPEVTPLIPLHGSYTSCDSGLISIRIVDSDGIDRSSVSIHAGTTTFTASDLIFEGDSIISFPLLSSWAEDGDTVFVRVLTMSDNLGNSISSPIEFWFIFDLEPPHIVLNYPELGSIVNPGEEISISLYDDLSGLNMEYLNIYFNDRGFTSIYDVDSNRIYLTVPEIEETLYVTLSGLSDYAEYCGANLSEDTLLYFIVPGKYQCAEDPSPFTPNGDMFNPVVYFEYPDMDISQANIKVYNLEGRKVKEISVDIAYPGSGDAFWDGNDEKGKQQPPGLYLYIIELNGEIICKGSVVLAR